MRNLFHRSKHKTRLGQSMVEFALAFPIFLLIVIGIMEFGRLFITYTSVYAAAREGARYGAAVENISSCGVGVVANADRVGFLAQDMKITYAYDHGPGTALFACANGGSNIGLGDRIIVTAYVENFESITGIFPPIDIQSQAKRTIIKNVLLSETLLPPGP